MNANDKKSLPYKEVPWAFYFLKFFAETWTQVIYYLNAKDINGYYYSRIHWNVEIICQKNLHIRELLFILLLLTFLLISTIHNSTKIRIWQKTTYHSSSAFDFLHMAFIIYKNWILFYYRKCTQAISAFKNTYIYISSQLDPTRTRAKLQYQ